MMMIELKLEYIVSIRNTSAYSTHNLVQRNISSINFNLEAKAYNKYEAID